MAQIFPTAFVNRACRASGVSTREYLMPNFFRISSIRSCGAGWVLAKPVSPDFRFFHITMSISTSPFGS